MSFANTDCLPAVGGYLLPLIGRRQKLRMDSEDCLNAVHQYCKFTDDRLKDNKYLIGEQVTLADFFLVSVLAFIFMAFDKVVRPGYPSLTRWFDEVYDLPLYKNVAGDLPLRLDLPLPNPGTGKASVDREEGLDTRQETAVGA